VIFLSASLQEKISMPHRCTAISIVLLLLTGNLPAQQPTPAAPPTGAISRADRERALGILDAISKGVQNLYYDPKMNGLDWNAVTASARTKIAESNSLNEALTQIAVAVDTLRDSHTTFEPPARPYNLDFGFDYQMIWSLCFVTRVRPGSDAEAEGLKPGTQILTINGTVPTRQNLVSIYYLDHVLDPRPQMRLELEDPPGEKKTVEVKARMTLSKDLAYRPGAGIWYDIIRESENEAHRMRMQLVQFGDVGILKFPEFKYSADKFFDLATKIRKDKALIIDLRGNPGGSVVTLKYFLGMFFDHNMKLFDKVERKKTSPEVAKSERHIYFPGKVTVLVDSRSASAAEIFARVMQLEKRGTVIGDRTSGSVMEATTFYYASSGVDYGAEVTVANLIMTDGKSLEHHGVDPDEVKLRQPSDLASGRDPVLTYAAQELGVTLSPEAAWKLCPYEWPKE
jgi:C-terminal processing protease CtpA/Prc